MKKLIKALPLLLMIVGGAACTQPSWDEHYGSHVDRILDENLMQAMQEHSSELSIFLSMLHQTGYDTLLTQSQSYTVWAPTDAYLKGIDLKNSLEVQRVVKNHISRFPYSTNKTRIGACSVKMLDKKRIDFWSTGESSFFGQQPVRISDITVNNGILHILDGYEPYIANIMEFMQYTPGYDAIYDFIKSYDEDIFMQSLSTVIGVKDGQTIYDSVILHTNVLLDNIGLINSEERVYTMIIPDNFAWSLMYDSISQYFVQSPHNHGVTQEMCDSIQDAYTNASLIYNLVFEGDITPAEVADADLLLTTTGTIIDDPKAFFADESTPTGMMQDSVVSNGRVYLAPELHLYRESWCPTSLVETEQTFNQATTEEEELTRYIFMRDARNTRYEDSISERKYIEVLPRTLSRQPQVTFRLNDLRSAAYNVYVVFVPPVIDYEPSDTVELYPTKVWFELLYIDESGTFTSEYFYDMDYREINPYKMDTVKVTFDDWLGEELPVKFPYNDACDDEGVGTRLRIYNAVDATELEEYTRSMLIDCIIVEPVD